MNGNEVFQKAMVLLGYTDANGIVSGGDALKKRAVDVIGIIGSDLCGMPPLRTLTDSVTVPDSAADALVYGTAMLLALGDGDGRKNQLFCAMYNAKRAAAKAKKGQVADTLPADDGGADE